MERTISARTQLLSILKAIVRFPDALAVVLRAVRIIRFVQVPRRMTRKITKMSCKSNVVNAFHINTLKSVIKHFNLFRWICCLSVLICYCLLHLYCIYTLHDIAFGKRFLFYFIVIFCKSLPSFVHWNKSFCECLYVTFPLPGVLSLQFI